MTSPVSRIRRFIAGVALLVSVVGTAAAQVAITTYHSDNFRTGWNSNETILTPTSVSSGGFQFLRSVPLDGRVDSQPLVMPNVSVVGDPNAGTHDVVYVATANNTVYAIDPTNGNVLSQVNLGTPVTVPCIGAGITLGVDGTPVIDPASGTLYVVAATVQSGQPTYILYALDVTDLTHIEMQTTIGAQHSLDSGAQSTFTASSLRQHPALLLANGTVYVAFGGYCDNTGVNSRGWLLGYSASDLTPLAGNFLADQQAEKNQRNKYLASIWMSGYGPAADDDGNIFFATGNSGPNTYQLDPSIPGQARTALQESVVRMTPALDQVADYFTPAIVNALDKNDKDFGAGGVLLLPPQGPNVPPLAAINGKMPTLYLLNRDNLGGFAAGPGGSDNVLDMEKTALCLCGLSYFGGAPGSPGYVVLSAGQSMKIWQVITSPAPALRLIVKSPSLKVSVGGQLYGQASSGFFTSVSSNGPPGPGNPPIIWAVSRARNVTQSNLILYAFGSTPAKPKSTSLAPAVYFQDSNAGSWPAIDVNSNIVPVVANGYVYVASDRELTVYGMNNLGAGPLQLSAKPKAAPMVQTATTATTVVHDLFGTIEGLQSTKFELELRVGNVVTVAVASKASLAALAPGKAVEVQGSLDADGVLHAASVQLVTSPASAWPADR